MIDGEQLQDARRVLNWQRVQKNGVGQGENRGVGANPERE